MTDSWWKKLLNGMENQDEADWDESKRISAPKRIRFGDTKQHVHVKMLNQYPKTPMKEKKAIEEHHDAQEENKAEHNVDENKFVPTYIPSPIFGFTYQAKPEMSKDLSVPTFQRKASIEDDLTNTRVADDLWSDDSKGENTVLNERSPRHENEVQRQDDNRSNRVGDNSTLSEASHKQEKVISDKEHIVPEKMTETSSITPLQQEQPRNAVENNQSQRILRKSHGTTRIPYNVLMKPPKRYINQIKEEKRELNNHPHQNSHIESPSLDLLSAPHVSNSNDEIWCLEKEEVLKQTLTNFNVKGDIVDIIQGPTVTRFELKLKPGVKVNKVINLTEDIKLSLAARQVRIAPVPGKNTVGIEIPNEKRKPVYLKQLLQSDVYRDNSSPLTAALGRDVSGKTIVTDLAKMPHGLIAGATGSGKSVCIHSLILSLIYKSMPEDLRLILIDPKVVELAAYQKLPHLAAPVLTQPKDASLALKWAVEEMERRYQLFAKNGVRDISRYNHDVKINKISEDKMPYIVVIIDELADLMMVSPQDVEEAICRIAQKARAAGIHLILATQRPSVDVITGLIKSNIPTRIAFSVSSQADSRTILDSSGADRLLGQGDMLFSENGARSLKRVQGCFVSDEEIDRVTQALARYDTLPYLFDKEQLTNQAVLPDDNGDEIFEEAGYFVIEQGQASISSLQRRFRIGYNRAARLIDQMESCDMISEANGSKPRQVIMSKEAFQTQILGRK